MSNNISDLKNRHEQLKEQNEKQHAVWTEIAKYTNPGMSLMFDKDDTEEDEYAKDVYDTTAMEAADTMADGITGNLISKSSAWVGMYALDPSENKKKAIQDFFQTVNMVILGALQRSNFYNLIHSYTKLGVTIATATMFAEEDPVTTNAFFKIRHPKYTYIDENWYGEVDTLHRVIRIGARAAAEYFVKDKSKLSKTLIKLAEDSPYEKVDICHALFPAKGEWFNFPGVKGNVASVYWEPNEKDIIRAGGFDSFPAITWRYETDGNEKYGRGPAHQALPAIRGINVMRKTLLQAAHKSTNPPLNIPEEMKNKVRNLPGGANYYRDPGRVVMPWNVGSNYPIGQNEWEIAKKQVEAPFYIEFWKLLTNLTQRMTAMEVAERRGEKATLIAAPISKFESEALDNLLFKIYEIESRNGRIPDVPPELKGEVGWAYFGPLAQMQKRSLENDGIKATLIDLERIFAMAPEALMTFNWTSTARDVALANGFPAADILSDEEVQKIKEQQAQAAAAQQKAEQMEKVGKAMGGLNQPVVPGSALEEMSQ